MFACMLCCVALYCAVMCCDVLQHGGKREEFLHHCCRAHDSSPYLVSWGIKPLQTQLIQSEQTPSFVPSHLHAATLARTRMHTHTAWNTVHYSSHLLTSRKSASNICIIPSDAGRICTFIPHFSTPLFLSHTRACAQLFIVFPHKRPSKAGLARMGIKARRIIGQLLITLCTEVYSSARVEQK